MTEHDIESIWKIIKKTRNSFFFEHTYPYCPYPHTLLSNTLKKYIKANINSVAAKLEIHTTYAINVNVSYKTLQTAVEMFTYLSSILV